MKNNTKFIALGGIMMGICQVLFYLIAVLPTSKLAFYGIVSFTVAIIIIEMGIKKAFVYYIANVLLALMIVPDKLVIVPYIVFFGIYGIVKFYIEKLNKLIIEIILKYVYFNICVLLGYIFIKEFLLESINIESLPFIGVLIILELAFFVFDYVYTLLIGYYNVKIRKHIKF